MGEEPRARGHAQASEHIREIARRLRDSRLDELTSQALARINTDEPEYANSRVAKDDLDRSMRRTLALALIRIAGDPIPDELITAATEVGRLRAQQGLSLAALLHSYRIDLRILWEAIIREARNAGIASSEAFTESLMSVWEAVEANTAEVVDAYRQTREELSKRLDVLHGRAFERLVTSAETDPTAAGEASKRLMLPMDSRYLVVVGEGVPVDHATIVSSTFRLTARGLASYQGWIGDEFVGIVRLSGRKPEEVLPHLRTLETWRCGACVVEGLAAIPRGVRLARFALGSRKDPGITLLQSNWPGVIVGSNPELAAALSEQILGPLLALPANDRAAVFETLDAYIAGDGSVAEIASQTLRHRNTVRNRLQSVERMIGLSLSRPQDIAALVLAMAWRRGGGAQDDPPSA